MVARRFGTMPDDPMPDDPKAAGTPPASQPQSPATLPWPVAEWLRREGAVMKGAPFSFAVSVIIFGVGIFVIEQWHYSGIIQAKDATITQKDAQIATVSSERDSVKDDNQRLARDNEQLRT